MRVAIVEDHPAERQLVKTMCTAYFRDKHDLDIDCGTFTGTDDFMDFVDEEDDILALTDFFHQPLHPFLKLTADTSSLN